MVIDCDPGPDDIAALILARQMRNMNVLAVTTVAGNCTVDVATRNTLALMDLLDWNIPVAAGASQPLTRPLRTAGDLFGDDGLLGVELSGTGASGTPSTRATDPRPAWDLVYDVARAAHQPIDIVTLGPLTNIATALAVHPDLPQYVERLVIMGGAFLAGNTTPAAEFNAFVDPEAAERVFSSGIPFWLCPLDVTHQGYITLRELQEVMDLESEPARIFAELLRRGYEDVKHYTGGLGVPLHDPLAVMYAADPSAFSSSECFIGCETQGSITAGMTITDRYSDAQLQPNGHLVETVDRTWFIAMIMDILARY
jgi:inosine-uridine nucleoside N-ribohydrolase